MIKNWKQAGATKTLFSKFGKFVKQEFFLNPQSGKKEEFILVGEPDSVGILAITKQNKVLLIRQFKQASKKILTEVPAGAIDKNETPLRAAIRELKEETGYIPGRIKPIGQFRRSTRSIPSRSYSFLATGCHKDPSATLDKEEGGEVVLIQFSRWLQMVKTGKIEDCLSVISTFLSLKHLN